MDPIPKIHDTENSPAAKGIPGSVSASPVTTPEGNVPSSLLLKETSQSRPKGRLNVSMHKIQILCW